MKVLRFWFGVFALLGIVVVAPAWMYWSGAGLDSSLPTHVEWLVATVMPFTIMLTIASWLSPGGTS
ncbi:hypothetical protein EI982_14625 [Haloplanus rallus]|uniref:Uncharacterized protein n=1 Tax=Haloplanus rallus TaxID=1816183 RepID=A0A6B9FFH0_9EURY|nr:hypothetical protein [Haloplanus rallus]QGX95930.1 hypothetical protein EI982_14625 [Haloplanus rallus]